MDEDLFSNRNSNFRGAAIVLRLSILSFTSRKQDIQSERYYLKSFKLQRAISSTNNSNWKLLKNMMRIMKNDRRVHEVEILLIDDRIRK